MRTYHGRTVGMVILHRKIKDGPTRVVQADPLIEIASEYLAEMTVTDGCVTIGDINPVTYRLLDYSRGSDAHIAERVDP